MEAHTLGLEESCDHFETRILQTPGVVQFIRIDWALLRLFFKTLFFSLQLEEFPNMGNTSM